MDDFQAFAINNAPPPEVQERNGRLFAKWQIEKDREAIEALPEASPAVETKRCPGCSRVLPLSAYHRNKSRPAGIYTRCKDCQNSADRERRRTRNAVVATTKASTADEVARLRHEVAALRQKLADVARIAAL
jgi:hypothetical protein